MTIALVLGLLVGIVLGLTGAGGSILGIPVLVFALGLSMQDASPIALIAVSLGAAVGTIDGLRHRLVRYRAAIVIAIAGFPMTSVGIKVAHLLPQTTLILCFAGIMFLIAYRLIMGANANQALDPQILANKPIQLNTETGRIRWTPRTACLLVMLGAFTGFLTGLLGVGGGFMIVPVLRKLTPLSMRSAVATSLMIIMLVSLSGVANSILAGKTIPVGFSAGFSVSIVIGMLIARRFANKLPDHIIQKGFASLLVVIAISLVIQNFATI